MATVCPRCGTAVDVVEEEGGGAKIRVEQHEVTSGTRYTIVDLGSHPWKVVPVLNDVESGHPDHEELCPFK